MSDHLQVGAVVPRIQYLADGVQTVFTYPFPIQAATDLQVWLGGSLQGAGYTVAGAGLSAGGAVTFASPPSAGTIVTLRRWLSIRRTTDFQDDGIIRARTLNNEFDAQTMVAQQLAEEIGRMPSRAPTSMSQADLTLPEPAAGRALKWNAAGTGLDNSTTDPDTLGSAAETATAAAATASAAASSASASAAAAIAAVGGVLTFSRVSVAGQADVVADQLGDTLALAAGANLTITTDAAGDTITIAATGGVSAAEYAAQQQQILQLYLSTALSGSLAAGGFVSGGYDAYGTDTIGANSTGQTYDSTNKLYWNPGTRLTTGTPSAPLGGTAANLNDNSTSTTSATTPGNLSATTNIWQRRIAVIDLGAATVISQVTARQVTGVGNGVSLVYSSDNSTGTILTSATVTSSASDVTWAGAVTARYLALCMTNASNLGGDTVVVADLNVYGAPTNMTLVSSALAPAPSVAPSSVTVEMLWDPAGSGAAINTDLTIEVSRDGGITWTAGTLADTGVLINGTSYHVLKAVVDVSGQPSGTAVKYRIKTLNAKTQKVKGVTLAYK